MKKVRHEHLLSLEDAACFLDNLLAEVELTNAPARSMTAQVRYPLNPECQHRYSFCSSPYLPLFLKMRVAMVKYRTVPTRYLDISIASCTNSKT